MNAEYLSECRVMNNQFWEITKELFDGRQTHSRFKVSSILLLLALNDFLSRSNRGVSPVFWESQGHKCWDREKVKFYWKCLLCDSFLKTNFFREPKKNRREEARNTSWQINF